MTKQKDKGASGVSKEAAENWDDAPAPGSQNPEDLKASQLMDAIDDLYGAV